MKLKDKRNEPLQVRANPIQPHTKDAPANHTPTREEIRVRAYEIYLERGGLAGNELDDWLQAERELERATLPKASEFSVKEELHETS
jgi:Protein of unknown function (DUF2934)